MEHVVFFPGPDAAPAFRRFSALEEAIRFVEHLRNVEGVTDVSVHALTPVPVAFRAYYRAEVPGGESSEVGEAPVAEMPAAEMPVADMPVAEVPEQIAPDVPVAVEPMPGADEPVLVPSEASANGKRSLGFFAH